MTAPTDDWAAAASCVDGPPQNWDAETWNKRTGSKVGTLRRDMHVAALCAECPVAAMCADDAIRRPWSSAGVVRAGVLLPDNAGARTAFHRTTLDAVAGGLEPDVAVLDWWVRRDPSSVIRWVTG